MQIHAFRMLAGAWLDLLYPRTCPGCGSDAGPAHGHVCWDCTAGMSWVGDPLCCVCGDPVYGEVGHVYTCAACRQRKPWFDAARSAARYRGPMQTLMQAFKYGHGLYLARDFSRMLQACIGAHWPNLRFDAVCAVPLHPRKQRERTYNQSLLLARHLARQYNTLELSRVLCRIRPTVSQTGLSASVRAANVREAFQTRHKEWIEGRGFLLVDDVMTTGATLNACARVLKKSGARSVHAVTVARG